MDPAGSWLSTGITWDGGRPVLNLVDDDCRSRPHPLELGDMFGMRIVGERRCVGIPIYLARACPFTADVRHDAPDAQCEACAAADPGRALARDAVRDPRPFRLYLAWFGPSTLKVGICASERGHNRLDEQGALAFTWLAHGDHTHIRHAELAVAHAGLAAERRRRERKLAQWPPASTAAERAAELADAHQQAQQLLSRAEGIELEPFTPIDNVAMYGLLDLKAPFTDICDLTVGTVVSGRIAAVVGNELVLELPDAPAVISARRLAGWPIRPTRDPAQRYTAIPIPTAVDASQQPLF